MRYVVHVFFQGLYASLEAASSNKAWSAQHGAMIFRDGRVFDMTEPLVHKGIRFGMKSTTAERLAPLAVATDYSDHRFIELFHPLWRSVWDFTPWIETAERELFFELSDEENLRQEMQGILQQWQKEFPFTDWKVFGGIGKNKLIAKMASRVAYKGRTRNMPIFRAANHAILFVVDQNAWMQSAQVKDLWPLPMHIRQRLQELGVYTVSDLLDVPETDLYTHFGKEAVLWRLLAKGEDRSSIRVNFPPVIKEVHWHARFQLHLRYGRQVFVQLPPLVAKKKQASGPKDV